MPEIRRMQYASNAAPQPEERDLADWESSVAKYVAMDFIAKRGQIPCLDGEDLVQEILVHWITQKQQFDENRDASIQTFFRKIAKNRLADIYRAQKAEKRGGGSYLLSLNRPVLNGQVDETELGDFIPDPEDMALEVEGKIERYYLLSCLTLRQKELAEGLEKGYSLADMARKMNAPRTTLNDELNRIRRIFRQHGYDSSST